MRKLFASGVGLALFMLGWGGAALAQKAPVPRGELRIVDQHPNNWAFIVYNVFDHLIGMDRDGKPVPRLATGWRWLDDRTLEVKLRQGVKFHNGEVFDAEIVKLNWEENTRFRQPFVPGAFLSFKPGSRLEIIDRYTVRFSFPEPDGAALVKLALVHMANRQFYREHGWGEKHW